MQVARDLKGKELLLFCGAVALYVSTKPWVKGVVPE